MPQSITSPSAVSPDADNDRCTHGRQEVRRRTYSNGVAHFVMQCMTCGSQVRSMPKEEAMRLGGIVAAAFDDDLQEQWREKRAAYWREYRESRESAYREQQEQRRESYRLYLLSEKWRRTRERRLAMDRWQCQARMDGCLRKASEVHHLTYDHLGDEPLFDLISVCPECHRRISAMDSAGAQGGANDVAAD